jgi:hypothetical protein
MPREVRHIVVKEMKRVSKRLVLVDYHIPDNSMERWFHILFTSAYEGKYYRDFTDQGIRDLAHLHQLKVVKENFGLLNYIIILVCDR